MKYRKDISALGILPSFAFFLNNIYFHLLKPASNAAIVEHQHPTDV